MLFRILHQFFQFKPLFPLNFSYIVRNFYLCSCVCKLYKSRTIFHRISVGVKLTKLTIQLSSFIIVLVWGYSCSHCGSKWSLRDRSYFVEERSPSAYAKQSELMCCTQFCTVTHQKTSQTYCKLPILPASCKLSTSCNKLQFHQVATSRLKSGLLQHVFCQLFTTC